MEMDAIDIIMIISLLFAFYFNLLQSTDVIFIDKKMTTENFLLNINKLNSKGKGVIYIKDSNLFKSGFFYYMPSYGKYREYTYNKIFKKNNEYYGDLYIPSTCDDFYWNNNCIITITLENDEAKQNGQKIKLSSFSKEKNICFIIVLPQKEEVISNYFEILNEAAKISKNKIIFRSHN